MLQHTRCSEAAQGDYVTLQAQRCNWAPGGEFNNWR